MCETTNQKAALTTYGHLGYTDTLPSSLYFLSCESDRLAQSRARD